MNGLPASGFTVLPLLIVLDGDGTPAIRCLCGAEGSTIRRGTAHQMTGLRAAPPRTRLAPDPTDLGTVRMILHARTCHRGQALMHRLASEPAGAGSMLLAAPASGTAAAG